jgi:hypothetical protein
VALGLPSNGAAPKTASKRTLRRLQIAPGLHTAEDKRDAPPYF